MLVVVTVKTKQLPVTAVWRIVVVIVIPVVNRHLVKILPNVVDEKFTPGSVSTQLKSRLGLSTEKIILTVGRMATGEGYKGQDRIISALPSIISEVPDVMYLIAGEGDDQPRLQSMAEKMSVESHVRFL